MNKLLNIFLFIVGFLVGAVCGANLYVTASNNEPKYFAQTTVNQGVNGINNILGTEWESPTGKPSSSEEFLHWWLEFINGFNKMVNDFNKSFNNKK